MGDEGGEITTARFHAKKIPEKNVAPRGAGAAGDVPAAERLRQRDNVRLQVPMLEAKHFPRATKPGLHLVGNQKRSIFAAKLLRANKEIGLRRFAALPLNGLDDKRRDITGA